MTPRSLPCSRAALSLTFAAVALGCVGEVRTPKGVPQPPGVEVDPCAGVPAAPSTAELKRLTVTALTAAVTALTGVGPDAYAASLPALPAPNAFDSERANRGASLQYTLGLFDAAERIGRAAVATPAAQARLLGCTLADGPCGLDGARREANTRAFIARLLAAAYRRAPTAEEVDELWATQASVEADPYEGAGRVVQAVVQSPSFLFVVERGEASAERDDALLLVPDALLERLALALWGELPDASLRARATGWELGTASGVRAAADEMLDDPRANAHVERMVGQWFRLAQLPGLSRTQALFPTLDAELKRSMQTEALALFDGALERGAAFTEAYTARRAVIDDRLAAHYGLAPVGPGFRSVELGGHPTRGGLFATAGFLSVSNGNRDHSNVVKRGNAVRQLVLCDDVPPAPPNAEAMGGGEGDLHARPDCAACHVRMDPIGKGLEGYDAVGAEQAHAGPTLGRVVGRDGFEFSAGPGLGAEAARSSQAHACVVKQVWRWSMGVRDTDAQRCSVEGLRATFVAQGLSLRALVLAFVASDTFRFVLPESP
ncbi:MAG: DUF1592 domain-containing protein [Myxococcaceae bacterium]|nr:DUF1592 domain-containing protein [Myxococcaceae bacterium]